MVNNSTPPSQETYAGMTAAEAPVRRHSIEKLLVLAALTLGFLMAPTLQGISLVADQSQGSNAAMQAADATASAEVARLTARP